MSYLIRSIEKEKCVFLSFKDTTPRLELVTARQKMTELLTANQWNRLVIDVTQSQSVTALELWEFASEVASVAREGGRAAFVIRPDQARYIDLIEYTGRNNGFDLTLFFNAEKAATWVSDIGPSEKANRQKTG